MDLKISDINKLFRLSGLFLVPDASSYLLNILQRVEPLKRQKVLRRLVDTILKQNLNHTKVSKAVCEAAVSECKAERNVDTPILYVIDAFSVPRFQYSKSLKKFVPLEDTYSELELNSVFSPSPILKAVLYMNRYEVIYQRLMRHPLFSKSGTTVAVANSSQDPSQPVEASQQANVNKYRIRSIEYLLASGGRIDSTIILGMLTQLREGEWYVEDPTGIVRLDLKEAVFHQGLFPEGSVVLIEAWYEDKLLHVTGMGLPPSEPSETSRRVFAVSNPFGGGLPGAPAAPQDVKMQRLLTTTQAGVDAMLVLLGETRLDRAACLDRLSVLFSGFAASPPVAFVLTGNLISPDTSGRSCSDRRSNLRRLLRSLIGLFRQAFPGPQPPNLILVPGPQDPVCSPMHLFPRPGLSPGLLPSDLLDDGTGQCLSWLHLASNPCRLRLYTREIVVFRADYTQLLVRHCIHLPAEADAFSTGDSQEDETTTELIGETGQTETVGVVETTAAGAPTSTTTSGKLTSSQRLGIGLARCLASQAHLLPLPGHIAPVYWAWDQALALHPLPSLVVAVEPQALADVNAATANASGADKTTTGECRFVNPGQFCVGGGGGDDYSFKVYYPATDVVEHSRLPETSLV